jgi:PST family polysaccharide transporter
MDGHFQTDDLKANLRRRSVHGAAITVGSLAAKFALNLGSTMILARLLTPQDFGLLSMVMSVTGLVTIFLDLGLATATVQSPSLDHPRVNALFWLNVLFGLAMGAVMAAAAPLLAWFFHEPRLTAIGAVLGGVMLLEGFAIQHQALLRRRMRFGALGVSEIASLATAVVVAVFLAWRGASYWALVWMRVADAAVGVVALWLLCDWRPSRPSGFREARSLVMFGSQISLARFVRYASRNLDRLLIGRVLGADVLGLYAKASGWLVSPFQQLAWPVARLAVPVLSRLQDEPSRFRTYYRAGLSIIAMFGVPIIVYIFVDASRVIRLVLGAQWTDTIPILRLLAPVAVVALFQIGFQWCYVALGRADRQLVWETGSAVATIAAFAVGLRWGVMGVAGAYSLASVLLLPLSALYCFRSTPVRIADLLVGFVRPAVAALGAGGIVYFVARRVTVASLPASVGLHALLFASAYALLWLISPGGPKAAVEFLRLGRELQKSRRSPA